MLLKCSQLRPLSQRSEEHTSELQSLRHLVCRLLLEKKRRHLPQLHAAACNARATGRPYVGTPFPYTTPGRPHDALPIQGGPVRGCNSAFFFNDRPPPEIPIFSPQAALPF